SKATVRRHTDSFDDFESNDVFAETPEDERKREVTGYSQGLSWSNAYYLVYLQYGRLQRPPTLLEEFGNGGGVRANPDLEPEAVEHKELGASYRTLSGSFGAGLALFQDDTKDKITFLPSVGQTMRAANVSKTRIQGAELSLETSYR